MKQALSFLVVLVCTCTPMPHLYEQVTYRSPVFDPGTVFQRGVCVLPFWDSRSDTLASGPSTDKIESIIKKANLRQVKLVSFKKVAERVGEAVIDPELLLTFERRACAGDPFQAPSPFWKSLPADYFLRLSVVQGEVIKLFNEEKKINMVFEAHLYGAVSRNVIWKARVVCRARVKNESDLKIYTEESILSLINLLPATPRNSYINGTGETW